MSSTPERKEERLYLYLYLFPFAEHPSHVTATCSVVTKPHQTTTRSCTCRRKMSNFSTDSSVSIDQDFFDSGYSYGEQKEQSYGGYPYSQQYPDYGQTAQQVPTYNYPSANNAQAFYDSTSYEYGGNLSYDYGASGPTTMRSSSVGGYGIEGSMRPRQTSEDYTSFEDEPPLLEGNNVACSSDGNLMFSHSWRYQGKCKSSSLVLLPTFF